MKLFEKNEGKEDRIVRAVLGALLLAAILLASIQAPLSYLAGLVGLILLFTAAMGSCLLYSLFGFKTLSKKK
ncbi:Uncharacterised protein [uncultured archaeon]|nr:Uncharacterised protein [uncultured archaeon]